MLNLLFAYPIYLINTNVGPTTHRYYTKYEHNAHKYVDEYTINQFNSRNVV